MATVVHRVSKVREEMLDHQEGTVPLDSLDHGDLMDLLASRDSPVPSVRKVRLDCREALSQERLE